MPVYRGDWTDFWADGIGSTPAPLKLFRDAQRKYLSSRLLDRLGQYTNLQQQQTLIHNLNMYAEHTWGHHASVTQPWNGMAAELSAKKSQFAVQAHTLASRHNAAIASAYGKGFMHHPFAGAYAAINPTDETLFGPIDWQIPCGTALQHSIVLQDEEGAKYPLQQSGETVCTFLPVPPHTHKVLHCVPDDEDLNSKVTLTYENNFYDTDALRLAIDYEMGGVVSIYDKIRNRELIAGKQVAFRPVYEVTPLENNDIVQTRLSLGMARRSAKTQRAFGQLEGVHCIENGPVKGTVRLTYNLRGCNLVYVDLTLYKGCSQLDVKLILHKQSHWDAEAIYLSLPFNHPNATLWIDKTACQLRPGIDQLPNSCMNFYSVQNGAVYLQEDQFTSIYCQDAPLLWLGELSDTTPALYHGEQSGNNRPLHSLVMNSFWFTNFSASLGGFHEFRYTLRSGKCQEVKAAFKEMHHKALFPFCISQDRKVDDATLALL